MCSQLDRREVLLQEIVYWEVSSGWLGLSVLRDSHSEGVVGTLKVRGASRGKFLLKQDEEYVYYGRL